MRKIVLTAMAILAVAAFAFGGCKKAEPEKPTTAPAPKTTQSPTEKPGKAPAEKSTTTPAEKPAGK